MKIIYDPTCGPTMCDALMEEWVRESLKTLWEHGTFTIGSDTAVDVVRCLIAEGELDYNEIIFCMPDCPEQKANKHGRLEYWPRRAYHLEWTERILRHRHNKEE